MSQGFLRLERQRCRGKGRVQRLDEDKVKESCEQLYERAEKCKTGLHGTVDNPSKYACNFMQGTQGWSRRCSHIVN